MAERTERHDRAEVSITTLNVHCVEGQDTGKSLTSDSEVVTIGSAQGNDLVLADPSVSRFHLELRREADGVRVIDHGSTNGTRVGAVRIERAVVAPGTTIALGRSAIRVQGGEERSVHLHPDARLGDLIGSSTAMRRLMAEVAKAARANVPVLIVGESGTGKEVVARTLHQQSDRRDGPYVTVDCGALTPTLVASELFGHERGAFTGADRRHVGAFESANGGTVFIDEIGELPPALQTSLLGVLERRRFRRLGGTADIAVDVRVVSATNRDLRAEVNANTFRLDLYFRLAVVTLRMPPLREHLDDLTLLVEHFLREAGAEGPVERWIGPAALRSLQEHRWPGNVRELRNVIEATLAMGEPPSLVRAAAPPSSAGDAIGPLLERPYKEARGTLLHEFESRYLTRLLERAKNNVSQAARDAGMDRTHLNDLLRRHGLR